ncbi:MAG: CPBP family intramembrane metalloprotease [Bacteroidia bacterium]|nr:CPBP family intramembrane metalloprotease [Bacteroidia bacterium]
MPLYKFISQILIAFGILIINLFVFTMLAGIICKNIYGIDITELMAVSENENADIKSINAIRIFQGIVSIGSFVFSSFVISYMIKQKPVEYLKLNKFLDFKLLVFIPILLIVSVPLISWLVQINSSLELPSALSSIESFLRDLEAKNNKLYELMLTMNSSSDLILNIIIMALIPAVGEELFCRGILLNIFYGYTGKYYKSVLIVALIFTLFHLQFYKLVPMVTISFLLGVFVIWSKGIWASIFFHFLNNSLAVIGKYLYYKGYDNFLTNQDANFPIYFVILSFVASCAIIFYLNKIYKNE